LSEARTKNQDFLEANSQGKEKGHLAANGDPPGTLAKTLRGFSINQRKNNYF